MMIARKTRPINGVGIGLKGCPNEFMQDIRVYPESGSVLVWAETDRREALQYLTPRQAVQFAWAFLRSAIAAWRGRP